MKEKIGSAEIKNESPMSKAFTTLSAFNLVGLIPLMPFLLVLLSGSSSIYTLEHVFVYSAILPAYLFLQ